MTTAERPTVSSRLGAFFTPHTLAMFILGLWLGYLSAVDQFRLCQQPREHGVSPDCPEWVTSGE
jgi:hypothetical protein